MEFTSAAQTTLMKLPRVHALALVYAMEEYEQKQKGYIKWLENRPGYRIRLGDYRVIFEFDSRNNEIMVLDILRGATVEGS